MNTGSVDDNKVAVGRGAQSEFRGIRVIGCTPGRVGLQVVKLQDVGRFNSKKLPQIKVIK